jgi:hypothetical protein
LFGAVVYAHQGILFLYIIMKRDPRYSDIKALHEKGRINSFSDIYERVGRTRLALNMGIRVDRFNKYLQNLETFTMKHILRIAFLCDLEPKVMVDIWLRECLKQKEERLGK